MTLSLSILRAPSILCIMNLLVLLPVFVLRTSELNVPIDFRLLLFYFPNLSVAVSVP